MTRPTPLWRLQPRTTTIMVVVIALLRTAQCRRPRLPPPLYLLLRSSDTHCRITSKDQRHLPHPMAPPQEPAGPHAQPHTPQPRHRRAGPGADGRRLRVTSSSVRSWHPTDVRSGTASPTARGSGASLRGLQSVAKVGWRSIERGTNGISGRPTTVNRGR